MIWAGFNPDSGFLKSEILPLRGCCAIASLRMTPDTRSLPSGDAARSRSLGMTIQGRMEDEHARPLLSGSLETAGRKDFIPYREARKDRELE